MIFLAACSGSVSGITSFLFEETRHRPLIASDPRVKSFLFIDKTRRRPSLKSSGSTSLVMIIEPTSLSKASILPPSATN